MIFCFLLKIIFGIINNLYNEIEVLNIDICDVLNDL